MKRFLVVMLFLLSLSGQLCAQNISNPTDSDDEYFYAGFGGLLDLPTQNINSYNLGDGAELITGFYLGDDISLQVRMDSFYFYGSNNTSIFDLRPTLELKYALDIQDFFQPYVFLGPGADIQYVSVNNTNSANLAGVVGLGVQFDLGDQINIFLEGKYNFIFQNSAPSTPDGVLENIPAEAGMTFGI